MLTGPLVRRSTRPGRRPSSMMWPSSGCSNPATMRRVVVLPQPEAPSREKNSPAPISRLSRSTATASSNRLTRFSMLSSRRVPSSPHPSSGALTSRSASVATFRHEPVDVLVGVLDGHQPLLDLAPWRQEDAAVVLHQPVRVAQRSSTVRKSRKSRIGSRPERDAPLGARCHDVPREPVLLDDRLDASRHPGRGARSMCCVGLRRPGPRSASPVPPPSPADCR